jgi:hypothetical protein
MKKLTFEQMESVNGGSIIKVVGCTVGSILLLTAFASLFALTAGAGAIAIASAAVGASLTPASCFTDY